MEKARKGLQSRKKVDIERSSNRLDSRSNIRNSLRVAVFCHGDGEVNKIERRVI